MCQIAPSRAGTTGGSRGLKLANWDLFFMIILLTHVVEPHANFKAIWAPYLRYLERPNTGQNQIYPGSAIGGLYFTSDIHRPCLRSSPKVTLDMEIDAAGVKILLVELSTLLI